MKIVDNCNTVFHNLLQILDVFAEVSEVLLGYIFKYSAGHLDN